MFYAWYYENLTISLAGRYPRVFDKYTDLLASKTNVLKIDSLIVRFFNSH